MSSKTTRKRRRSFENNVHGEGVRTPTSIAEKPLESRTQAAKSNQKQKAEGDRKDIQLHECSFAKPHVAGFTAIDTTSCGTRLAVSTTEGLVHLYQLSQHWAPVSTIYPESGSPELAVSCLKFSPCSRYLFVSRLDGSLSMHEVTTDGLLPYVTLQPGGGAIWDMSFAQSSALHDFFLAVACDDGRVRFVRPDPDYPSLLPNSPYPDESSHYIVKASEKSSGRVLCVTWAQMKNPLVVCGDSEGRVRWIDPITGFSQGNGQIPSVRKVSVLIWTILTLHDGNTVVCGDDRGLISVWSSKTQTLVAEINIEGVQGAIWCAIAVNCSKLGVLVVAGCANGAIGGVQFAAEGAPPMPFRASLLHTHDVRGIAILPDTAFASASVDGQIIVSSPAALLNKNVRIYRPEIVDGVVTQAAIQINRKEKLMAVRRLDSLEFWHLPCESSSVPTLRLKMNFQKIKSPLRSFAMSADAQLVATSSTDHFRLYRVWDGEGSGACSLSFGQVKPVSIDGVVEGRLWGSVDMAFCNDNLATISRSQKDLMLYNISDGNLRCVGLTDIHCSGKRLCKVDCRCNRVAVSDSSGAVFTALVSDGNCRFENINWVQIGSGSSYGDRVVALSVSPSGRRVAFAHGSSSFTCVSMEDQQITNTVKVRLNFVVNKISIGDFERGALVSGLNQALIVLFKNRKHKRASNLGGQKLKTYSLHLTGQVWTCDLFGDSQVLVVRKNADVVQSYLPDAIPKKKFGH